MTNEQFNDLIENHDDIMLHCGKFKFTIMTCFDQLLIGEQGSETTFYFENVENMLEGFKIKGEKLGDVIKDVVLDSCS